MLQALLELCRNQQKHLMHSAKTQTWRFIITLHEGAASEPRRGGEGAVTQESWPPRWGMRGQHRHPPRWGVGGQDHHTSAHMGWGLHAMPVVPSHWGQFSAATEEFRFMGRACTSPGTRGYMG